MDIAVQRLYNQHITGPKLASPEAVVRWLGAVQSQDYAGAKWSLGQRMDGVTDAAIDEAFAKGAILRTHVLRPTWHFVTADDILWILELTAPRVHALNAYYYRQLELDTNVLDRSHTIIEQSLRGGIQLTRPELGAALAKAGIVAETLRLTYIVMHAELDGVICSGALRGKQQTYALVADRVPNAKRMPRDEALAELTHRYFTGHGPITLKDYVWWSGLSASDARSGLEMNKHRLSSETVEGQTYWFGASMPPAKPMPMMAHLIPEYDESLRGLGALDLPWTHADDAWTDFFYRPILIDTQRAGTWRRRFVGRTAVIDTHLFTTLDAAQTQALHDAAERYARFIGMPVTLAEYP